MAGPGKPGRKKTPTPLQVLKGGRKDRINTDEPKAPDLDRVPRPPKHLSEDARKEWRRLAKSLHEAQLLTAWDLETFAMYCEAVAERRRCYELVKVAILVTGHRGAMTKTPAWQPYRDACDMVRRTGALFGLNPSSRSELKLGHGSGQDGAKARYITR